MIEPQDIQSLSDFQRSAKTHIARLKKTGRASVLTVNGKAAVVVQDAAAYARMAEMAQRWEDFKAVREGVKDMEAGRLIPFERVFRDLRAKHGLKSPRRRSA